MLEIETHDIQIIIQCVYNIYTHIYNNIVEVYNIYFYGIYNFISILFNNMKKLSYVRGVGKGPSKVGWSEKFLPEKVQFWVKGAVTTRPRGEDGLGLGKWQQEEWLAGGEGGRSAYRGSRRLARAWAFLQVS